MLTNILLLVYSILFIHFSVGHVGCFYLLTVVNNSTVNNIIYLSEMFSKLLAIYLRVNLPGHMVVLCVTFQVTTKRLPTAPAPFYIPTTNTRVPISPHPCQHVFLCFLNSHHSWCEVVGTSLICIIFS